MKIAAALSLVLALAGCASVQTVPAHQPRLAAQGWEQINGPIYVADLKMDAALGCDKPRCGGFGLVAVGRMSHTISAKQMAELRAAAPTLRAGEPMSDTVRVAIGALGPNQFVVTKKPTVARDEVVIQLTGEFPHSPKPAIAVFDLHIAPGEYRIVVGAGETLARAQGMFAYQRDLELPRSSTART